MRLWLCVALLSCTCTPRGEPTRDAGGQPSDAGQRVSCPIDEPWPVPYRFEGSARVRMHGAEFDLDLADQRAFCGARAYADGFGLHAGDGALFATCVPGALIRLTSDKATTDEAVLAAAAGLEVRRTHPVTWERTGLVSGAAKRVVIAPGRRSATVTASVSEMPRIMRRDGAIDELPNPATVRVEVEFDCAH